MVGITLFSTLSGDDGMSHKLFIYSTLSGDDLVYPIVSFLYSVELATLSFTPLSLYFVERGDLVSHEFG